MNRLRHVDELVGFLVLLAIIVMVAAILEAGFLGRWFQPTTSLRILLPSSGVGGLVSGATSTTWDVTTGTLVIDLFDIKTERTVFRGTARDVLQRAPSPDMVADANAQIVWTRCKHEPVLH